MTFFEAIFFVSHRCTLMMFLFFFQAEDGIRDIGVTGVQTCALPISVLTLAVLDCRHATALMCARKDGDRPIGRRQGHVVRGSDLVNVVPIDLHGLPRSEERRVGKECRSRWSPYH